MSATYEAAIRDLNDASGVTGDLGLAERGIAAQIGTGRAVLALAEEVEALVELVRERLSAPVVVEYFTDGPRPATSSPAPPDPVHRSS